MKKNKKIDTIKELHRKPEIPVHIVCDNNRFTFFEYYSELFNDNQEDTSLINNNVIFARYGSRPLLHDFPQILPQWNSIKMDITSILIASYLEVFDHTYKMCRVFIPGTTFKQLSKMRDNHESYIHILKKLKKTDENIRSKSYHEYIVLWIDRLYLKLTELIANDSIGFIDVDKQQLESVNIEKYGSCLDILQKFTPEDGDIIWIDDRAMNKFLQNSKGVPIFGINEIMQILVSAGKLTPDEYYSKLLILRAGNVRFIPVGMHEILFHLENARFDDNGNLNATPELKLLKNYISACIFQGYMLEQPDLEHPEKGNRGETPFLIDNQHNILFTIKHIWENSEIPLDRKRSISNWLVDYLYIDHPGLIHTSQMKASASDDINFLSISLLHLIIQGTGQKSGENDDNHRKEYYKWLEGKLLSNLFNANKNLLEVVVNNVKKALIETEENYDEYKKSNEGPELTEEQFIILNRSLVQKLYDDFPKTIQKRLGEEPEYLKNYEIELREMIIIKGYHFVAEEFYNCVSKAINGCETEIKSEFTEKICTFKPKSDDEHDRTIVLHDNKTSEEKDISDDVFRLLIDDREKVRDILHQFPFWFDLSNNQM